LEGHKNLGRRWPWKRPVWIVGQFIVLKSCCNVKEDDEIFLEAKSDNLGKKMCFQEDIAAGGGRQGPA